MTLHHILRALTWSALLWLATGCVHAPRYRYQHAGMAEALRFPAAQQLPLEAAAPRH